MGTHETELAENLRCLISVDWSDIQSVRDDVLPALEELASPPTLGVLLERAVRDQALLDLSERTQIFDKVTLLDVPGVVRVRLHIFVKGNVDLPHNHRWCFASRIIRGSYSHALFGSRDDVRPGMSIHDLKPQYTRVERAGDSYVLSNKVVHTTIATPGTVSLVARGPAVAGDYVIFDASMRATTGRGAHTESEAERRKKRISRDAILGHIASLHRAGLVQI